MAQPEIKLPELVGLSVKRPRVTVSESHVDQSLANLKEQNGIAELNVWELKSLGYETIEELRSALRDYLMQIIKIDVHEAMRSQVKNYLLTQTQIELAGKLRGEQAEIVNGRRELESILRHKPDEEFDGDIRNAGGVDDEKDNQELKLFYILGKIAGERTLEVDEEELDVEIQKWATKLGKDGGELRRELEAGNMMGRLLERIREDKTLDSILKDAEIEAIDISRGRERQ